MAALAANPAISSNPPSIIISHTKSKNPLPRFILPITFNPHRFTTTALRRPLQISNVLSNSNSKPTTPTETFLSRFAPEQPRKGSDVLVEALEREGVKHVFAYPGGATMEIHQSLTRCPTIRNVLPRNEQGGIFAAEGYARASGLPGVCIATSGPGATNLVSGLSDAMLDSIPIDIPRIVKEAFFLARSGRPGPVLIDVPKDLQQQLVVPNWDQLMRLPGYMARLPKEPEAAYLEQVVRHVSESKKPVLYVGGGCLNSSEELRRFVELTAFRSRVL
ncbi:hypothetical protein RHGRI_006862 [Rhododendron griersonianum]|uniref:Thiamine pyrophosphate enzyme N-terminal TPP-binding domain-containing protein n=1 Tax=Rhododendron griersonianum TaxID=479676 RepID=A0AAV6KWC0_9ERIC|nr:hypothetical protein RHGRI_006862 [Rhododendron griersonianum]